MAVPTSRNTNILMAAPATFAVTDADQQAVAARSARKWLSIVNFGDNPVSLAFDGNAAVFGSGVHTLNAGGSLTLTAPDARVRGPVNAICDTGLASTLAIQEGV